MATSQKNLNDYEPIKSENDLSEAVVGIVVSTYHSEITESLYNAAVATLTKHGIQEENVIRRNVPGAFELSLGAQFLALRDDTDAVICLGCVIQGETRHFEFICQAIAQGITTVSLTHNIPVSFGVLTTDTVVQAQERAGGKHGNKGVEAAAAVLGMLGLPEAMLSADLDEDGEFPTFLF